MWRAHFIEYLRKWESFISIWKRDFNQWDSIIVLSIVYAYASHFHDMYSDGIIHVVLKVRRKAPLLSTISCNIHDYHIRQNKSHKLCYHDKFPSNWFGLVHVVVYALVYSVNEKRFMFIILDSRKSSLTDSVYVLYIYIYIELKSLDCRIIWGAKIKN